MPACLVAVGDHNRPPRHQRARQACACIASGVLHSVKEVPCAPCVLLLLLLLLRLEGHEDGCSG